MRESSLCVVPAVLAGGLGNDRDRARAGYVRVASVRRPARFGNEKPSTSLKAGAAIRSTVMVLRVSNAECRTSSQ
jgi:hypothetical protein